MSEPELGITVFGGGQVIYLIVREPHGTTMIGLLPHDAREMAQRISACCDEAEALE